MVQEWKTPRREPACCACERAFADGEAHFSSLAVQDGELLREDLCPACWKAPAEVEASAEVNGGGGESIPAESAGSSAEASTDDAVAASAEPDEATATIGAEAAEPAAESSAVSEPGEAESVPGKREVLVWWRTRHEAERKRKLALDVDLLEQLFRSLAERDEQNLCELRYLLCLLLMRKRRLKVARVLRAGEEGAESESFLCRRPRTGEEFLVPVFDFTPERTEELRNELRKLLDGVDPDDVEAEAQAEAQAEAEARAAAEAAAVEATEAGETPAKDADADPEAVGPPEAVGEDSAKTAPESSATDDAAVPSAQS